MHRRPSLFRQIVHVIADRVGNPPPKPERKSNKSRLLCEFVGWGCVGVAAGMVALPLGLIVAGAAFFTFSIQLR